MAPLPPPLSTSTTPDNTNTGTIPCSCLLSSVFRCQLPFSSPSSHSKNTILDKSDAFSLNLGMLHTQMVSAAERFRNALISAAAENPLLKSILSLSGTVQRFSQIRFGASNGLNSRHQSPLLTHSFAAILPGDSVAGLVVANGLANFLNLYNTILVVRLVLTWFPGAPSAIVSPLSTICDPYLNIFRGIIPPLGGTLDLSPILAFLVLNAFTSTAAALPAELPAPGTSQQDPLSYQFSPLNLTTLQQKWMRRVSCKQKKVSSS